jgi:hypothetical protein
MMTALHGGGLPHIVTNITVCGKDLGINTQHFRQHQAASGGKVRKLGL